MGYQHYFEDDRGRSVVPANDDDWVEWVAASRTRNFCQDDTLADWLDLYGAERGHLRDDQLPAYDERTDFASFIFAKGQAFEAAVLAHLGTLFDVVTIEANDRRSLAGVEATWNAMASGAEVIAQGVLRNPQTRTYGAADLLIRSDVLAKLFPDSISGADAAIPAPAFSHGRHYRVVDIKFSTLDLDRFGHATSGHLPYMAQVAIYNAALGRIQGYEPFSSYLLGRGWRQRECGETVRGQSCLDRLARVDMAWASRRKVLAQEVEQAVAWLRRVRREGAGWRLLPEPSVPELRPNAKTQGRWASATRAIAIEIDDITLAWRGSPEAREHARALGVTRWTDPACTAGALGISGACNSLTADRLLEVNRGTGPTVVPERIRSESEKWAVPGPLEFYVDFETVSNLDDDFAAIPQKGGQDLIFMVGCGHFEDGEWRFATFTASTLELVAEARMLGEWFAHMDEVTRRLSPTEEPLVFHWSPAETSALTTAFNSARERHRPTSMRWPEPRWYDFLARVMKAKGDPIAIRGAMGFVLKAVANALHQQGLVDVAWGESITGGLGAMVAAWNSAAEARESGAEFPLVPLMVEVARYNEVDCRAMAAVIAFLRTRAA